MTDTGPQYPPPPAPGSNAVGVFAIGQSQIGTIPPFNWWATVLSQYANSPVIIKLMSNFFDYVDQTKNLDDFFDKMWSVYTAQGYGLDCWGTIVAVNRVLRLATGPKYVGFVEGNANSDYDDFGPGGQSPWYSGQKLTDNFILSDDGFRVLILAKAFANICDGSIPAINHILKTLFGAAGKCYCTDGGDMSMTYTFEFNLTPVQLAIVTQSGVLPTPTGVSYTIVQP